MVGLGSCPGDPLLQGTMEPAAAGAATSPALPQAGEAGMTPTEEFGGDACVSKGTALKCWNKLQTGFSWRVWKALTARMRHCWGAAHRSHSYGRLMGRNKTLIPPPASVAPSGTPYWQILAGSQSQAWVQNLV